RSDRDWSSDVCSSDLTSAGPFHHPSLAYPLGTDDLGRDVFSRVLYGARASWLAALGVILIGAAFGALIGAVAGAFGGILDTILRSEERRVGKGGRERG